MKFEDEIVNLWGVTFGKIGLQGTNNIIHVAASENFELLKNHVSNPDKNEKLDYFHRFHTKSQTPPPCPPSPTSLYNKSVHHSTMVLGSVKSELVLDHATAHITQACARWVTVNCWVLGWILGWNSVTGTRLCRISGPMDPGHTLAWLLHKYKWLFTPLSGYCYPQIE